MSVNQSMKIQAVDDKHQALIERERQDFEKALETGSLQDYYRIPTFGVLMAAGSEGSFLNPSQGESRLAAGSEGSFLKPNQGGSQLAAGSEGSFFEFKDNQNKRPADEAAFAKVLVLEENKAAKIYKGQFAQGRFFFQGLLDASATNITYLITLDQQMQTQVFVGRLSPTQNTTPIKSVADSANAPSEHTSRYGEAIRFNEAEIESFKQVVDKSIFLANDRLPPMMRSRVLLSLIEAFPEIGADVYELFGLPPIPHDDRVRALRNRYKEKFPQYFATAPADDPFVNPPKRGGVTPPPTPPK